MLPRGRIGDTARSSDDETHASRQLKGCDPILDASGGSRKLRWPPPLASANAKCSVARDEMSSATAERITDFISAFIYHALSVYCRSPFTWVLILHNDQAHMPGRPAII